ncbi:MAG: tRNA (N(6)-L-threonylcarbamoyladenosine(37)-C(2))-methylthiotransferase MtaB, partial [Bacteroidaceae bacterium]|nr:tRNA (N(6)-L-threonylcarbamoyladenosine(37)-C(2))-methylthiotransferase MtaB [Bacteroidaceae bacterium]
MIDLSIFQHKKVAFYTLGCKLNFAETSSIGKSLKNIGVEKAGENETADICIINTCSVTEVADQKGRHAINKLVRENPGAFVVVIGCYAQLKPEQVAAIKGVDLVLGAEQKGQIIEYMS